MILNDYNSFDDFFESNKSGAKDRFNDIHSEFKKVFDEIIKGNTYFNFKSKQKGTAITIYLRATKYLFTMHNLALIGHVEEARVLSRSIIELIIIAYLISKADEVFRLWEECFAERLKRTSYDGKDVYVELVKDKKFNVDQIIKNHSSIISQEEDGRIVKRLRGEFSTYYSHENLYNIVPRIEQGEERTEVYIGNSYKSNNLRMQNLLVRTLDLANNINRMSKALRDSVI